MTNLFKSRKARAKVIFRVMLGVPVFSLLCAVFVMNATVMAGAQADELVLYPLEVGFESTSVLDDWVLSGDWRFKKNSACLGDNLGYTTPTTSLVFDYGSECAYRNNRSGFATMTTDIAIPINTPSATLEWWDFVAAEAGSDFYFVQVSTDGGATWPDDYEVFRESVDEEFWDYESVDMTRFIGQSVRIRFGFSSDDTITNLGWYIDDVRIVGEGLGEGVSAVAISDSSLTEGSGTSAMPFELAIDPANDEEITLEYVTVSGSAQAGLDFVSSSGLLTIPAGAASATINVPIVDDVLFEHDEMFQLIISNPSHSAVITIAAADGTIFDNEELECLYEEGFEPQGGTFRWTVPHPVDPFGTARDEAELWHVVDNTTCFGDGAGYSSPTHALVCTDETSCSYDTPDGIEGWVEMTQDIRIVDEVSVPNLADNVLAAPLSFIHHLEIAYSAESEDRTEAYVEISNDG